MMHECIRVQILISIKDNEYRRFFEIPARRTSFVPYFALGMRTKLVSNFVPILFHSRRSMTVVVEASYHAYFSPRGEKKKMKGGKERRLITKTGEICTYRNYLPAISIIIRMACYRNDVSFSSRVSKYLFAHLYAHLTS